MAARLTRRQVLRLGLLASAATLAACSPAGRIMLQDRLPEGLSDPPDDPEGPTLLRLMNRAGYGPRPGDLDYARSLGYTAYLEEQLHPEEIDDTPTDLLIRNLSLYGRSFSELLTADHEDVEKELVRATLIRALTSRRTLYESVVEFWSDHFAIYTLKDNEIGRFKLVDDREVIRPNALETFPMLLLASASSPATLVFLDNVSNFAEAPNENYARELMELHTLGIAGGYTQADVGELARALTGWAVHMDGFKEGAFTFNPEVHDPATKRVIGHTIPAGSGESGIREMLDVLALHPSTARFISRKLARQYVADDPPESLVAELAGVFMDSGGDIRTLLRSLFLSDSFKNAPPRLKRPLHFILSALRGTGADVSPRGYRTLYDLLNDLGHKPFGWPMPDGYPVEEAAWLGTLLGRWNSALRLAGGDLQGIRLPLGFLAQAVQDGEQGEALDRLAICITGRPLSNQTRLTLTQFIGNSDQPGESLLREVVAALLASPEFQMS